MRYKLLSLAVVLLIATPAFGQETSPIIVETLEPTPSVVRSGELFQVTYRVKFYDSVLISEDQMQPENIVADPFEALKLQVVSLPDYGDENTGIIHVQDFVYTFRIIKPEKGDKKIPSFKFIWVIKRAGTTKDNAKQAGDIREIPTEEVGVRYSYSPVKPPDLDIRDEINFPLFKWTGEQLRNSAYVVIATSSVLALLTLVALVRSKKNKKKTKENSSEVVSASALEEVASDILPKKARKKFLRELEKLLKGKDIEKPSPELEKKVFSLLRELILVELSGEPIKALDSDTPSDLYGRLISLGEKDLKEMGLRFNIFFYLVSRAKNYYEDMESGQSINFQNPSSEISNLIVNVSRLNSRKNFWKFLLLFFGFSNAR